MSEENKPMNEEEAKMMAEWEAMASGGDAAPETAADASSEDASDGLGPKRSPTQLDSTSQRSHRLVWPTKESWRHQPLPGSGPPRVDRIIGALAITLGAAWHHQLECVSATPIRGSQT